MKNFYYFLATILFLLTFQYSGAQSKLKTPEEFLGYELGTRFTRHHRVIEYFKYIAREKSNIKIEKYGETYEHRPLIITLIASEKNFSRLEEIRKNNLTLAGFNETNTPLEEKTSIVWLSYNVHGNESVGTEAAMATLYDLADPKNSKTQKWLENTVVIIDPCINPDGRDRYVNWYNQYGNTQYNPDPNSKEHHEPWPGGRANHYLFDLNRDWAWLTQIESKQRVKIYNTWLPHVHVDFHEQGVNSPYYFAPAAEPFHKIITDWQREFQTTIGKNHARYFDNNGWLYFTREVFDLFYPSYGDTYPTFNGAIGLTYEQGGSGRAGLGILTNEGDTLTLKDRIDHHYTTGLSTVEITSLNADKVVNEFSRYFKNGGSGKENEFNSYIIKSENGKDKLNTLMTFLDNHRISYGQISSTSQTIKGFDYQNKKTGTFTISKKDIIIPTNQPKSTFIQALFEPESKLSDSITYDITAWSVPYSHGLKAYATGSHINISEISLTDKSPSGVKKDFKEKPYAYLAKWNSLEDVKWVSALLQKNIKIRFSEEPFEIENQKYEAGSLIITRRGNESLGDDFDKIVLETATEFDRAVYGVSTGFVNKGKDFGSGSVTYLKAPKVAILSGEKVSSLAFGEVWHYFEQQINYPVSVLNTDYFSGIDLSVYDVLILPNGSYGSILKDDELKRIKDWVRHGGRLIAMENALSALADKTSFSLKKFASEEDKEKAKKTEKAENKKQQLMLYKERERNSISGSISGSIFKLRIDNTHPLGFGYPDHYFTLKRSSNHYPYLNNGWNVAVIENKNDWISGFAGHKAIKKMGRSLVFGVENAGQGAVIYMVDNPLFRAFWQNGKLLFSNAVFMVGQ